MMRAGFPDCFVVVNGPEDGTEFPVVRAPFHIGSDVSCAVNVRLDPEVRGVHAQVTVVSDGYRIRRTDEAPVYVDGKRAGIFRSRIVRAGGMVQVGHTLLAVECQPDGLAGRSRGIITESDLAFAVRQGGRGFLHVLRDLLGGLRKLFGHILGNWIAIAVLIGLLYVLWPRFHYTMNQVVTGLYRRAMYLLSH